MEELNLLLKKLPEELKDFDLESMEEMIDALDPDKDRLPTFYVYDSYSLGLKMVRDKKKDVEKRIFAAKSFEEVSQLKEESEKTAYIYLIKKSRGIFEKYR